MSRRRTVVWIVIAVVAVNAFVFAVDKLLPSPSGPPSSSYATAQRGLAAWASLLERNGHPVSRERALPAEAGFDPASTVVVLDPDAIAADDARALRRFLDQGGRLVAGGLGPDWLEGVVDDAPEWTDTGEVLYRPDPESRLARGTDAIAAEGLGSFETEEGLSPIATARGRAFALEGKAGRGTVMLVADPTPLHNRLLGRAGNALLALRMAGEPGRPVRFVESVHGYGQARGITGLPGRWKLALAGLALAGIAWLVSRARRLGPPEPPAGLTVPPRSAYVDALAASLARTKDMEALARVASRLGMPADQLQTLARGGREPK